jgi:hypothetical protein
MELKFENLLGFFYLLSAYYIVHYGSTYVEQYNARSKRLSYCAPLSLTHSKERESEIQ